MPALLLASPAPLAGKTTLAAGLAQKAGAAGESVALKRLAGNGNAAADAAFFESFPGAARDASGTAVTIIEAAAGEVPNAPDIPGGIGDVRIIAVMTADIAPAEAAQFCRRAGAALAGVVLNRVPKRRIEAGRTAFEAAGMKVLAALPEDRVLAAPVLAEVATALNARTSFLDDSRLRVIDRPLVASISADPGQAYFTRTGATAVIVRGDKPDLQLGALNAGANCLIVTGGLPILSYVLDRAEEDGIPLLRTDLDTVRTVEVIEALFAAGPFAGGQAKMQRTDELLADLDALPLLRQ